MGERIGHAWLDVEMEGFLGLGVEGTQEQPFHRFRSLS